MRHVPAFILLLFCVQPVSAQVASSRDAFVATQDPLGEPVTKVVYLEQNWSPEESLLFYFTEQGSQIIPYDWFLALEQVDQAKPFRENENILKYRYLPQNPGKLNPDGLPVGFVMGRRGLGRSWFGMTCAACHTAEIRVGDTGYRVDAQRRKPMCKRFWPRSRLPFKVRVVTRRSLPGSRQRSSARTTTPRIRRTWRTSSRP